MKKLLGNFRFYTIGNSRSGFDFCSSFVINKNTQGILVHSLGRVTRIILSLAERTDIG